METLKLLLISFEFPPYPLAGTGMYAYNLVRSLKGHEVTVLTPNLGKLGENGEAEGIDADVKRVDIFGGAVFGGLPKVNRSFIDRKTLFAMKLRKYLRGMGRDLKNYDVLHSITLRDAAFLNHEYLHRFFPTIVSINDYYVIGASWNPLAFHFKSMDFPVRYLHHNIMRQFYIRTLRGCSKIVPNSKYIARILMERYGIEREKIKVIYRGIDLKKFEIKVGKEKYRSHKVLFIGANMERKGAVYLVKAAPAILKEYPDAKFVVVGDAIWLYWNRIKGIVGKYNMEKSFGFMRHVDTKRTPELYRDANVFVMTPVIENLAQVYMEAMMTKTPVVAADVGAQSELISKDCGILVRPKSSEEIAKAVLDIFSVPKRAEKMGDVGRRIVKEKWSLPRMVRETLGLYRDVINGFGK